MRVISHQHFNFGGEYLATVYFKKTLVDTALDLIKLKGAVDKLNAKDDIDQIDSIFKNYFNGYGYNAVAADLLDQRIRREHPIIEKINRLSSSKASYAPKSNPISVIDPVISNLIQDCYGIFSDLLLKEGLVHELDDFVDRVE